MNLCWDKNSNLKIAMCTYRNSKRAKILSKPCFICSNIKWKDIAYISPMRNYLITNMLIPIIAKGKNYNKSKFSLIQLVQKVATKT